MYIKIKNKNLELLHKNNKNKINKTETKSKERKKETLISKAIYIHIPNIYRPVKFDFLSCKGLGLWVGLWCSSEKNFPKEFIKITIKIGRKIYFTCINNRNINVCTLGHLVWKQARL